MIVTKNRSKARLFVLRMLSYIPGVKIDLGLSTSAGDQLLKIPSALTPEEISMTLPIRRKEIMKMTPEEIYRDEQDREARYALIRKLREFGIVLPNDQLLNIMNFDGPPMYVPKTTNTVFVFSGHSMASSTREGEKTAKFDLENLVDGSTISLTREQLDNFFQKVH